MPHGDASSATSSTHPGGSVRGGHLFIELEELKGTEWAETCRWNHALEEEGEGTGNTWSKPHLPTVSIPGLAQILQGLRAKNIILDLSGMSLTQAAENLCQTLVARGLLPAQHRQAVFTALSGPRGRAVRLNEKVVLESPKIGPAAAPMPPHLHDTHGNDSFGSEPRPHATDSFGSEPRLHPHIKGDSFGLEPRPRINGNDSFNLEPRPHITGMRAADADELFHMLDPDEDEEGTSINVAHFNFLEVPLIAFARMKYPIDAGCEKNIPVRFLVWILAPEKMKRMSVRMAHAFAGMLLDERLVAKIYDSHDAKQVISAITHHLNSVHVLPHVQKLNQPHVPESVDSMSEASHPNAELEDEDGVLLHEVEQRLRKRKGLPSRLPAVKEPDAIPPMPWVGRNLSNSSTGIPRRPTFETELNQIHPTAKSFDSTSFTRPPPIEPTAENFRETNERKLFILAEQLQGTEWVPTHQWNWALEQESNAGKWSRPHLPTISVGGVMALLYGLGEKNIFLDLSASTLKDATNGIIQRLVSTGALDAGLQQQASQTFATRCTGRSNKATPTSVDSGVLAPDEGESCFQLLVAHVDFVSKPVIAFARLVTPLQLDHCERDTPVRWLFIVLGPKSAAATSVQMTTALGCMMLDEDFLNEIQTADSVEYFLQVFGVKLDTFTIVPHSHMIGPIGGSSKPPSKADPRDAPSSFGTERTERSVSIDMRPPPVVASVSSNLRGKESWRKVRETWRSARKTGKYISRATRQKRRWIARTMPTQRWHRAKTMRQKIGYCAGVALNFSLPLLLGIVGALIWANVDGDSYEYVLGADKHEDHFMPFGDVSLFGHPITLHFLINDVFMVFFFGLATKEVTEACLPGGSLNPPRKALSPLIGTLGGVAGPVATYILLVTVFYYADTFAGYVNEGAVDKGDGSHRLLAVASASSDDSSLEAPPVQLSDLIYGWGVPTATDISLAWMVAMQVFQLRHPAIDFLLLLAVADDAIGLVIIAAAYSDPDHPIQPQWLAMNVGAVIICLALRLVPKKLKCSCESPWYLYILLGGITSWIGLLGAQLHPALALVFVVPVLPADGPHGHDHSQLQMFEHRLKTFVDCGLFFFTLANAGVDLSQGAGPLSASVLLALVAGKAIGIFGLAYLADLCKLAPLPARMSRLDLLMVGLIASIGLTVALFISGEAFKDPKLQSEAKFGALLSGLMGGVCILLARLPCWRRRRLRRADFVKTEAKMLLDEAPEDDEDDILNAFTLMLERSMLLRRRGIAFRPLPPPGPAIAPVSMDPSMARSRVAESPIMEDAMSEGAPPSGQPPSDPAGSDQAGTNTDSEAVEPPVQRVTSADL